MCCWRSRGGRRRSWSRGCARSGSIRWRVRRRSRPPHSRSYCAGVSDCEILHNMRKIAESTVRRLSLYLRYLEQSEVQGHGTISSAELARRGGTTPAQVRKDLSFFGSFGKGGLVYLVPELAAKIPDILGLNDSYPVLPISPALIGGALWQHHRFRQRCARD